MSHLPTPLNLRSRFSVANPSSPNETQRRACRLMTTTTVLQRRQSSSPLKRSALSRSETTRRNSGGTRRLVPKSLVPTPRLVLRRLAPSHRRGLTDTSLLGAEDGEEGDIGGTMTGKMLIVDPSKIDNLRIGHLTIEDNSTLPLREENFMIPTTPQNPNLSRNAATMFHLPQGP